MNFMIQRSYNVRVSRQGNLMKHVTRMVIDQGLQAVKQALDDLPEPFTAEDRKTYLDCRQLLLGYRHKFREDRDLITGIRAGTSAYLIDDPDVT